MRTGVEGCGVVVWFGQYTEIAFLASLFGFTQPIHIATTPTPNPPSAPQQTCAGVRPIPWTQQGLETTSA